MIECESKKCGKPAVVGIKLRIPAQGYPAMTHEPISMLVGLKLCQACCGKTEVRDFLSDDIKKIVGLGCKGRVPPDFGRAYIEQVMLASEEWKTFEAMNAKDKK